jgi:CRP-like cAMP-binding protein
MPHSKNHLLARASPVDLEDLGRKIKVVDLKHGQVLADTRQRVPYVYFPHSGILSAVVVLESGWTIETGMVGKDGVFGAIQALDGKLSLNKVMVQVPGQASVVDAEHLKAVCQSSPEFLALLVNYENFFLGQVQQTTACNALHTIEQRTCKWLVRMYDLVGTDLPLTQEFMAQMMGVQRTSVNGIATQLQSEGLISYRRGHVTIVNIDLVQRRACECQTTVREQYADLFGNPEESSTAKSGVAQTDLGEV